MDFTIAGNRINIKWGEVKFPTKYEGEDIWETNKNGELVSTVFHIFNNDTAGSKKLNHKPDLMKICKPDLPIKRFKCNSMEMSPIRQYFFEDNMIVEYQGNLSNKYENVVRVCDSLYIILSKDIPNFVYIRNLNKFKLQIGAVTKKRKILLSQIDSIIEQPVLNFLIDNWLYSHSEKNLPKLLRRWTPILDTDFSSAGDICNQITDYIKDILEEWEFMLRNSKE